MVTPRPQTAVSLRADLPEAVVLYTFGTAPQRVWLNPAHRSRWGEALEEAGLELEQGVQLPGGDAQPTT